jgi:hypothetical protein
MNFDNCKLELIGDIIVCEPTEQKKEIDLSGFSTFSSEEYKRYKIVDMHFTTEQNRKSFEFEIGDTVIASSNVQPVEIGGKKLCLYHPINITAKIKEP